MKNPPKHLTKILWEYDIDTLEMTNPIVLERVLSFGNREDITYVGLIALKQFFREKKPLLDQKSHNFWSVLCDMPRTSPPPSTYDLINHPTPLRSFR